MEDRFQAINDKIAGKSDEEKSQRTSGIYSVAGLALGLGVAYVRRKGVLGYVGYGILGVFLGNFAGRIISTVSSR